VAEGEGGFCGEFLIGAVAGGEGEAVWLSGQEGWEEEEKCAKHHIVYIGCLKHLFREMF
jgi:hypothetical protein